MLFSVLLVAACSGGSTPTIGPVSTPAGPASSPGGPASASTPGGAPPPAGSPIGDIAHIANILTPADFGAVGVSGANAGNDNASGNGHYIVYAGKSAADGGIELDIFLFDTSADAQTDFGDVGLYKVDPAMVAEIGADQVGYYPDQPGNTASTSYDEVRVLKGNAWFDLGIPSNADSKAQLTALAALVVARGASIF